MDTKKIIEGILNDFGDFTIDDIPDIDLYMDQVTTLLNGKLETYKRNESDKILTKTMINNYAKFRLLPAPEKKKYSKDHIIMLLMICFFKNVLSINDIHSLLGPATEQFFHNEESPLSDIYNEFLSGVASLDNRHEILKLYEKSKNTFKFDAYDNSEYLQKLAFITVLSYQSYIRQQVIIRLVDDITKSDDTKSQADNTESVKDKK